MRELQANEFTSLSLILPENCDNSVCTQALVNCGLRAGASEVTRLVLRSTAKRAWVVECSLFAKEDIPERNGGLPGRRLAGPDRGRGEMGDLETEQVEQAVAVRTPVVLSFSN